MSRILSKHNTGVVQSRANVKSNDKSKVDGEPRLEVKEKFPVATFCPVS